MNSGVGSGIDSAADISSVPGVAVGALMDPTFAAIASVLISAGDISAIAAGEEIDDKAGVAGVVTVVVGVVAVVAGVVTVVAGVVA